MTRPHDLQQDAIELAIEKSMEDLETLLRWIRESDNGDEALRHIRRARELLEELEANLPRRGP